MKYGIFRAPAVVMTLALAACGGPTLDEAECPPEGTTLTYDNFARGFFELQCQTCHGSSVKDRRGAPAAYVFDTHEQIVALDDRIYARAAGENDSMPPGPDDPSEADRERLAEWLACGAP